MRKLYSKLALLLVLVIVLCSTFGTVGFSALTIGDTDGNSRVDEEDAVYLLYSALFGEEEYPIPANCDFNGDGNVNSRDAVYLLYHVLYGEQEYPLFSDNCSHEYEGVITKQPKALAEGEKTFTCKLCDHSYTEIIPETKTLKILALGNNYSSDAMHYLWSVANDAGVENIVLGTLTASGAGLDTHWENISNDTAKYTYKKNTTGIWESKSKYTVANALADEEWDVISLQQSSGNSAVADSFGNLGNIVDYLSNHEPNAEIMWHLTWSYQHDDTIHGIFKNFDRDPVKMYNAIVDAFKTKVQTNAKVVDLLPSGTAVQNLRSSYIGDTITRDTYNISYSHGRYLLALTWFAKLTGGNVDNVTWLPSDYPELIDDIAVIRQSAKDAVEVPLTITQQYTGICAHEYESVITKEPKALEKGEKVLTCKHCDDTYTEIIPETKTLKVLALGNSFSVDAMQYLWDIAHNAGVENIVLGNLYIASCNLDMHWENISNSNASYSYYKNTTGKWSITKKTSVQTALADEEWDIISVQQSSGKSAQLNTFGNLSNIVNYLTTAKPNARLVWHLTWSYQHDNTIHGIFKDFDRDPVKMYNAIANVYQQNVQPNKAFTGITPSGTAVQNLRSSYIGDTITRDTYHLSYSHGRYIAALTWFAALTGGNVDDITWLPSDYPELADDLPVIRQSVKDAIKTPLAITQQAKEK